MRFEFKPSFDRSIKAFPERERQELRDAACRLIDALSGQELMPKGMGLKKLRGNFWEMRKGLKTRILFRREKDWTEFILAGDHNDIKRFLKDI